MYLVLDVETTGLKPGWHEICQIGCMWLDAELKEVDRYSALIKPRWIDRINAEALSYSGLCLDTIVAGVDSSVALGEICKRSSDGMSLVGHNVSFDLKFLIAEEGRCGIRVPRGSVAYDTLILARKYLGLKKNNLTEVSRHFGIEFKAHDAMEDVVATAGVFRGIVGMLRERGAL